jgi:hypothetical protein
MALTVKTSQPAQLLAKVKKAIDDRKIDTWTYDSDGDFTHSPPQWKDKAWLKPKIEQGELTFRILGQENVRILREVYGVYHGRLIEMLLVHFPQYFTSTSATP